MPSSKEIIKRLKAAGWKLKRSEGDHFHFVHPEKPELVTVPHPMKDIDITLLKLIKRQAGMKLR